MRLCLLGLRISIKFIEVFRELYRVFFKDVVINNCIQNGNSILNSILKISYLPLMIIEEFSKVKPFAIPFQKGRSLDETFKISNIKILINTNVI